MDELAEQIDKILMTSIIVIVIIILSILVIILVLSFRQPVQERHTVIKRKAHVFKDDDEANSFILGPMKTLETESLT